MNVELLAYTGNPGLMVATAARTCYSTQTPREIRTELEGEDIQRILGNTHPSTYEHAVFTFSITNVSRVLTHQLVRHRMASFCISGESKLRTSSQKTNNRTIAEIYAMSPQYKKKIQLRCMDENTHALSYNTPLDIVYSGVKPTYTVKTIHGYEIRTTKEHRFLTDQGWKQLEDIAVGEKVYINGVPNYKDKAWLKEQYADLGRTQKEIAQMCGVSKACIRAWVRKYGLQKTSASEWGRGRVPHNKGKSKEDYAPMRKTSEKMMGNTNCPHWCKEDNPSWREEDVTESGLRQRVARKYYPLRKNKCAWCGFEGVTEFHHLNKNLEEYDENIVELCVACHHAVHHKEISQRAVLSEITSIEYFGEEDTYDVMMPGPNHNFIADGFVVHNSQQSQRYAGIHGQLPIIPESVRSLMAPSDGYDTRVDKAVRDFRNAENILYSELKRAGVPEEDIRYFAPQGTTTNIVVTMNLRELSHFCGLRRCKRAQWEIRDLADRMAEIVEYRCPEIARMGILRRQCGQLGYCPESKGCGMSPTFRQRVHKEALLELEMFRQPGIDEDGAKAEIRSMLDDVGEGEE